MNPNAIRALQELQERARLSLQKNEHAIGGDADVTVIINGTEERITPDGLSIDTVVIERATASGGYVHHKTIYQVNPHTGLPWKITDDIATDLSYKP